MRYKILLLVLLFSSCEQIRQEYDVPKVGEVWRYHSNGTPSISSECGCSTGGGYAPFDEDFLVLSVNDGWIRYVRVGTNDIFCSDIHYFKIGSKLLKSTP